MVLDKVKPHLKELSKRYTSEYISMRTGFSRTTVWRYLNNISKTPLEFLIALEKSNFLDLSFPDKKEASSDRATNS